MATLRPGSPDWVAVDWREHQRWLSVGDRLVNVVDLGTGPDSALPIVFIHGVDGCWTDWLEQLVFFAGSRRVVALDLPGFGWSEPAAAPPGIADHAGCVGSVCSELGIDRTVLCGHSMGGVIAADLALGSPGLVDALVLAAPAILWGDQRAARPLALAGPALARWSDWSATHWQLAMRHRRLRHTALSRAVAHPERLAEETAYEMLKPVGTATGFLAALRALGSHDLRPGLGALDVRTLVLWGAEDQLMSARFAAETAALAGDAELEVFPDVGHCLQLEAPERFNAAVAGFLDG